MKGVLRHDEKNGRGCFGLSPPAVYIYMYIYKCYLGVFSIYPFFRPDDAVCARANGARHCNHVMDIALPSVRISIVRSWCLLGEAKSSSASLMHTPTHRIYTQ